MLLTGKGTSGSWQIRGVQLGAAIGADVIPDCLDVGKYDLAVLVKRPQLGLVGRLKKAGVPIVWDVVDAWPQPYGNHWAKEECLAWLKAQVKELKPKAIIAATGKMADDCDFGLPVLTLPHHCRPNQRANPIREQVKVVGYEGGPQYLGEWHPKIEAACRKRGWSFVVNPNQLADLDIVLAVRQQDGYAPRHWKSNVKLANAQGTGTPVVCNREWGYMETACGAEFWADSVEEIERAFDALQPQEVRRAISRHMLKATISLESVAAEYKAWLTSITR